MVKFKTINGKDIYFHLVYINDHIIIQACDENENYLDQGNILVIDKNTGTLRKAYYLNGELGIEIDSQGKIAVSLY